MSQPNGLVETVGRLAAARRAEDLRREARRYRAMSDEERWRELCDLLDFLSRLDPPAGSAEARRRADLPPPFARAVLADLIRRYRA